MTMRACLQEAARILNEVRAKRGAVKPLVLTSSYHNKRQMLAIVCETLKYTSVLNEVIEGCDVGGDDPALTLVLLYEHLVGRGLRNAGSIRKIVTSKREEISRFVQDLLAQRGAEKLVELLPPECRSENDIHLPRYARVNYLRTSVADVVAQLTEEGWMQCHSKDVREWLDGKPSENQFLVDPILSDVLIFPPRTELHDHPLCHSGSLILQDRASCFPAHVLQPAEGSVVIDCCAAPGNKTSHLASLMANTGTIYAFDWDKRRVATMEALLGRAGVSNTQIHCQDFLTVSPTGPPYCQAEFILLDPSCSGSGMVGRLNHLTDDKHSGESSRLQSLGRFQISLLKHALRFPHVRRVAYSTCSIHAEENEAVVQEVLDQVRDDFRLRRVFPEWTRRGLADFGCGTRCLRMSPQEDLTNGFFVACFERRKRKTGEKRELHSLQKVEDTSCHEVSIPTEVVEEVVEDKSFSAAVNDGSKDKGQKEKKKRNRSENCADAHSLGFDRQNCTVHENRPEQAEEVVDHVAENESLSVQGKKRKKKKKKNRVSVELDGGSCENGGQNCSVDENCQERDAESQVAATEAGTCASEQRRKKRKMSTMADTEDPPTHKKMKQHRRKMSNREDPVIQEKVEQQKKKRKTSDMEDPVIQEKVEQKKKKRKRSNREDPVIQEKVEQKKKTRKTSNMEDPVVHEKVEQQKKKRKTSNMEDPVIQEKVEQHRKRKKTGNMADTEDPPTHEKKKRKKRKNPE